MALVIGLMSGTSLDGMDAALVEIEGAGLATSARLAAFLTVPYDEATRRLLRDAAEGETGGSRGVCLLNALIGEAGLEACRRVCERAGVDPSRVDLVGSHGQTIWHQAEAVEFGGRRVRGTLQVGEPAIIAEGLGCPVVSGFRARDMAAGGQGAPLVPYTEWLLYRSATETRAFLNLGGIGNVTALPAGCSLDGITAFDTGPGNMLIDGAAEALFGRPFDEDGRLARSGAASPQLLGLMVDRDAAWLRRPPPKSTGREAYGRGFLDAVLADARVLGISSADTLATITAYTPETVRRSLALCGLETPPPGSPLVVCGGGRRNPALLDGLARALPAWRVRPGEDFGINSDAKEAVAFAILARETMLGRPGNVPTATNAARRVILGSITPAP